MSIETLYDIYRKSAGVTTDSRAVKPGELFFAIRGETFNGNLFAADALKQGALHAVVDEATPSLNQFGTKTYTVVTDSLKTLQQLALHHRRQLQCPVLAITGSNGKTTTKELVHAVMSKKFRTHATRGNLNNHIGIPLTLLGMPVDTEFAIVEMGANHQGEIASYCTYTEPDHGLITNIGKAHLEGFGGEEGVLKGKTELYRFLQVHNGKVFVNISNDKLITVLDEIGFAAANLISYGNSDRAAYRGNARVNNGMLVVTTANWAIQTNLVGVYNFENAMSAICIGRHFGVPMNEIADAIQTYHPSNNRSQQISWKGNTVILDAYNANPSSMKEALDNFRSLPAANKALILGEMLELGEASQTEHEQMVEMAKTIGAALCVFVGNGFAFLKSESWCRHFDTVAQAKSFLDQQPLHNATLLIKGSRKNRLEEIVREG